PNAWDSGTRAMFAFIRDRREGYARVCFSVLPAWYATDTYVRYYIVDLPLQKIDDITDPACFAPGTLLVTDASHTVRRPGFKRLTTITDVNGDPFAVVTARPVARAP
ncbi:MAG TPA: hypothetical protein VIN40_04975, partial [Candidatus Tyrphobacter sp.]